MRLRFIFILIACSLGAGPTDGNAQSAAKPPFTTDDAPFAITLTDGRHSRFVFVGSTVRFRSRTPNINAKGKIVAINQTTVTIQKISGELLIIPLDTVAVIIIPRSIPRKLAALPALAASIGIAVGAQQFYEEDVRGVTATTTLGKIDNAGFVVADIAYVLMSAACLAFAIELVKAKKVDLTKRWGMKITKDIVPGNLLHIITKQGEAIGQLVVTRVKDTSIKGSESWVDSDGQFNTKKKVILFSDIQEWSRTSPLTPLP